MIYELPSGRRFSFSLSFFLWHTDDTDLADCHRFLSIIHYQVAVRQANSQFSILNCQLSIINCYKGTPPVSPLPWRGG